MIDDVELKIRAGPFKMLEGFAFSNQQSKIQ